MYIPEHLASIEITAEPETTTIIVKKPWRATPPNVKICNNMDF